MLQFPHLPYRQMITRPLMPGSLCPKQVYNGIMIRARSIFSANQEYYLVLNTYFCVKMCVGIKYPEFDPDIRLYVSKLWLGPGRG